jgi:hypothetical protein
LAAAFLSFSTQRCRWDFLINNYQDILGLCGTTLSMGCLLASKALGGSPPLRAATFPDTTSQLKDARSDHETT